MDNWVPKPAKYRLPTMTWRFLELETAKEWGMSPWKYDELDGREKAEMMAFVWASRKVENYHADMATAVAERESKSVGRR